MIRNLSYALVLAALAVCNSASASANRTFVSAQHGVDLNSALGCSAAAPCRTFGVALGVTNPGGEIIAIDSGGYGPFVIDRSVSVEAPDGVYAGIAVPTGTGILIATAGVTVHLRGLTINGTGGTAGSIGIDLAAGSALSIEHVTVSNFVGAASYGLRAAAVQTLSVVDSTFRDCLLAVVLTNVQTATITGSRFLGTITGPASGGTLPRTGAYGVWVQSSDGVTSPAVAIVDCVVNEGVQIGFAALDGNNAGAPALDLAVDRSLVSGSDAGLGLTDANSTGATIRASASRSTFTHLRTGALGVDGAQATALLDGVTITDSAAAYAINASTGGAIKSFGNNTLSGNAVDSGGGVLTPLGVQ